MIILGSVPGLQGWINIRKFVVIDRIIRFKEENNLDISVSAEKNI